VNIDTSRIATGFGWGIIATIGMSTLMIIGYVSGRAPMPRPIPEAIALTLLGDGAPTPLVRVLGVGAHLLYGGIFGAVLATVTNPVTVKKGVGLGIGLWILMEVIVLPFLGWGLFGTAITPAIAVATLILHLVYGTILGWGLDRNVSLGTGETAPTSQ
jgi:hypothetical protein